MAGGLDIGTLSGRVELEDNLSGKVDILINKVDQFSSHYSEMGKGVASSAADFFTAQAAYSAVIETIQGGIEVFKDMTMQGARIADVEENFDKLNLSAGRLGETLLSELREGTHNTITDFELMKSVNDGMAAGLQLTDNQYKELATGGFALAQAKGIDVKQAFDAINDAMATGQARGLRQLDIRVDTAAAEEAYATKLNTTIDRLTFEQKLEADRGAILEKVTESTKRLGVQIDGLDEKVDQAKTRWGNFYENLSKSISTSPEVMKAFDDIQGAINEAFGDNKKSLIQNITAEVAHLATTAASAFHTITEAASGAITVLKDNQGTIEAGASALGGYYAATTLASTATTVLKGLLGGVSTLMAEVTTGTLAASAGLIGAAAALGAFIGYSLGKLQPISDFFQGLALRVEGYSSAEVDAMIATDHANQAAIESGKAAQEQQTAAAESAKKAADAATAAANAERIKTEETHKAAEEQKLSAAELKAYIDAWKDLNSIGGTWQETLATIDTATRDSAQYYLNLGASVKEVQSAFKLTGEQAKALAQDLKTQQAAVEFLDQAWTQYYQDQADLYATDTEKAKNAELNKYTANVKKLQDMGDDNVDHYNQLWSLYQKDVEQNEQAGVAKDVNSKTHLDIQVREQEEHLQQMLLNSTSYNQAEIQAQIAVVQGLHEQQQAWNGLGQAQGASNAQSANAVQIFGSLEAAIYAVGNGLDATKVKVKNLAGEFETLAEAKERFDRGSSFTYDLSTKEGIAQYRKMNPAANITWSDDQIMAYIKKGGNLQGLIGTGIINPYGGIPGFASGGPTKEGLAYVHDDEFVVPKSGALVQGSGGSNTALIAMLQSILNSKDQPGGYGSNEALTEAIKDLQQGQVEAAAHALEEFKAAADKSSDFTAITKENQAVGAYGSGDQLFQFLIDKITAAKTTSDPIPQMVIHPGAIVLNYPIMNDRTAMDNLSRVMGDSIIQKLRDQGWRPGTVTR